MRMKSVQHKFKAVSLKLKDKLYDLCMLHTIRYLHGYISIKTNVEIIDPIRIRKFC